MQYLEHENEELPEKLVPRPEAETRVGDILFTRAGPTNRVAISCLVQATRPKLMISDKIIRFHPIDVGIDGRFMTLCLNTGATASYLESAKSGIAASQVNISQEKLRLAPIPLPPLAYNTASSPKSMSAWQSVTTKTGGCAEYPDQQVDSLVAINLQRNNKHKKTRKPYNLRGLSVCSSLYKTGLNQAVVHELSIINACRT